MSNKNHKTMSHEYAKSLEKDALAGAKVIVEDETGAKVIDESSESGKVVEVTKSIGAKLATGISEIVTGISEIVEELKIHSSSCGSTEEIDKKILAIIKENSYSQRILAAYEGQQNACSVARLSLGYKKKESEKYVEMLMKMNYPQELEKAILGKKFLVWLGVSVFSVFIPFGFLFVIPIIIWIVVPTYKKLKLLCS